MKVRQVLAAWWDGARRDEATGLMFGGQAVESGHSFWLTEFGCLTDALNSVGSMGGGPAVAILGLRSATVGVGNRGERGVRINFSLACMSWMMLLK